MNEALTGIHVTKEKSSLFTEPTKDSKGLTIDRAQLARASEPWGELSAHRVPIHFGEMGCPKHTPPEVVLTCFDDTVSVLGDLRSGWALRNVPGPFGVLHTQRAGTRFEDWHGHQLDRPLLALLQKIMKEWRAIDRLAGMLSSAFSAACLCELSGQKLLTAAEAQAYRPNARNEFSAWPTTSV
ncbi:MAG TPA: hypothetical protein VMU26_17700 [Candidatus Polarisedimenticolia bacterium]|nr:hypothetical protein [Candidatus Polarisedimenticolia bacterium]